MAQQKKKENAGQMRGRTLRAYACVWSMEWWCRGLVPGASMRESKLA